MRPWLRTRHLWVFAGTAVACAVGLGVLQGGRIAVPIVLGRDGVALWSTFLPLAWAIAVADCFSSKLQSAEIRPSQRVLALDTALLLVMAATGVAVFSTLAGPHESATAAAGHVLAMTGIACSFTLVGGPGLGVLVSSGLLIATTFYAVDAPGGRYVRVFQPDGAPAVALLVGVLACLVAGALILGDRAQVRLGATAGPED